MTTTAREVQSVNRALDLLQHVADAGGTIGLSRLARESGLPLSTVHRITRSMVSGGYLCQEADRRYSLGLRLVPLGDAANRRVGAWTVAQLERLVEVTGETANAATLAGDSVHFVAQLPSPYSMRTSTEAGRRTMAHCSGVGKALLSLLDDSEVRAIVGRTGTPAWTPNTLDTADKLVADLQRIRDQGFAVDDEEEVPGARCVAVPVVAAPVPLSLSVSGPTSRITQERVFELGSELRACADAPM
jgi:IclR family acetate operon transcriptional repressor